MRRLLLPALVLLAASPAAAQSTQQFRSATAGYTLQVPASWRALSPAELNRLRASAGNAAIGRGYEAGYLTRRTSQRLPLLAVATMDLGAVRTREQFRGQLTGPAARAQMQATADATIRAGHRADYGMPEWDEENGAVWTRVAHAAGEGRPAFTLAVALLHPDGHTMINLVYLAAPGQDEARVRAELLAVVRSLQVT